MKKRRLTLPEIFLVTCAPHAGRGSQLFFAPFGGAELWLTLVALLAFANTCLQASGAGSPCRAIH
jgi:hypothetical protein